LTRLLGYDKVYHTKANGGAMFVGRKTELAKLETLYKSERFECVIIYGRRRVGKTRLINEFIREKKAIYFSGLESSAKENLEMFSKSIFSLNTNPGFTPDVLFPGFKEALDAVFNLAKNQRIILAIDEYPYLAGACREISSLLQFYIDRYHEGSKLFLILCGSSLSFMENQVLGYQSPLFGRRTAQFKISPLDFYEMAAFYKNFNAEDLALIYGITGGIPQYMIKIDENRTLAQNIQDNFFDPASYLFEEPVNLIKQECREPAQYNAIIRAIATGASKLSIIASKTGINSGICSNYLSTLSSLGIIKKEFPAGNDSGRKTIYVLADSMFKFWYRFIPDNMALIQRGQKEMVYQRIAQEILAFMGGVFEEMCKQWCWRENIAGRLPIQAINFGRWWGNDPVRKQEAEINILGFDDNENALFGECKWTSEKINARVLQSLMERSELFSYRQKYLYLFSRSGFSSECIAIAEKSPLIHLIPFSKMFILNTIIVPH
jgi:AAA+ ATPase superfamily predicted ATPase